MCFRQLWQWLTVSQFQTNWQCCLFPEDSPWTPSGPGGLAEPGLASESCRRLERCCKWCHRNSSLGTNQRTSGSRGRYHKAMTKAIPRRLHTWGSESQPLCWLFDTKIWECCSFTQLGHNPINSPVPSGSAKSWFHLLKASEKSHNRDYVCVSLLVQKIWAG